MEAVVLDRHDVDATVRQSRAVGLLPLRADRVIDREALETALALQLDEVSSVVEDHSPEQVPVGVAILVALHEVTHDVLRGVRAEHARHARPGPSVEDLAVASLAGGTAGVSPERVLPRGTRSLRAGLQAEGRNFGMELLERTPSRLLVGVNLAEPFQCSILHWTRNAQRRREGGPRLAGVADLFGNDP